MGSPLSYISFPFSTPANLDSAIGVLPLNKGGTGNDLVAPVVNAIPRYNPATQEIEWLYFGSGLVISGNTVSAPTGGGGDLISTNNLSDLEDIPTALGNLGVGSAGLQPSSAFVASSAVSAFALTLLDDANNTAARTTLGLGTASQSAATDFVASSAVSAFALTLLDDANNTAARTTLGLGTSATYNAGVANGVALLDSGGKLDPAYIPTSLLGDNQFQTAWDASTNTPAIPVANSGNKGHFFIASSSCEVGHGYANVPNVDFRTGDWVLSDGVSWLKIDHTDAVVSVAGRIGNVTLDTNDISGLGTAATEDVGVANGVAPLDASTLIAESFLPATVKERLKFINTWDATSNVPAIPPASSANVGHLYVIQQPEGAGHGHPNVPNIAYNMGDWLISNGSAWFSVPHTITQAQVIGLSTVLNGKLNASSPSSTGTFSHTGGANNNSTFTQSGDGRFQSENNSTGRTAGYQNAIFSTRFDSANSNQVGLDIGFYHTSGDASTTNKFTPFQGLLGGSQKMSYGLDIVPSTTWTASGDVKAKLIIYIGGAVSAGFGIDTGAGTRRYFLRSNSANEFGIVIPDSTNYNITIPSSQGAAGSVLTNDGNGNTTWTVPSVTVTGFTPSDNTASPNATVNASRFLATATSTNADLVIQPKGSGALLGQLPDNASTGGNKRGTYAVDLQLSRASASQVASGNNSILLGTNSTASGTQSCAIGIALIASGTGSLAIGTSSTASASNSIAIGNTCTSSADNAFATGNNGNAYIHSQFAIGACISVLGDAQTSFVTLRNTTTNATPTNLLASASAGGNNIAVPVGKAIHFVAKIIAINNSTKDVASFMRDGVIKNNSGTTALVGSIATVGTDRADASMSSCSIAITADDTQDRLQVAVTGIAGNTIRWCCSLIYTEIA